MTQVGGINVEQADVHVEASRVIRHDIPLPDHPLRRTWWFQILDRAWRIAIYWFSALGTGYIMFVGHLIERPMDEAYAALCLIFVGGLIGNKTLEKMKGVA